MSQSCVLSDFIISSGEVSSGKGSTTIAVSVTGNIYDDRVTRLDVSYNENNVEKKSPRTLRGRMSL